ncbi:MAG: hypothetical protein GWN18_08735, partial [Thermoplasmata archaeon]|nr:hypothetical protein [Thermoplasmata archaeon]NIS12128.1 hypothetical protein [Thermoplasmata archaeon]NIS20052.1 hypothetical protein [Thermoplasmata archaeon]NIT77253.1 hypothetical protein [Thermoplasmata archaeon]NIU49154.1 hypothetical protein [Thermoplasmata archaeon]
FALVVVVGLAIIGIMRYLDVEGTFTLYRVVSVASMVLVTGYVLLGPLYVMLRERGPEGS